MFAVVLFAVNLLFNPSFCKDDGLGGLAGWSVHNVFTWAKPADWKRNVPVLKALRDDSVEISFAGREPRWVRQNFIKLAAGGRYRMSAEVRTAGLKSANVTLKVNDISWKLDSRIDFPDDTKGEWRRLEAEFSVPADCPADECSFGVFCNPNKTETVRVELRHPVLEPLDEKAASGSSPVAEKYVVKRTQRIVPVAPTLFDVSSVDGEMTFYWPGAPVGGRAGCSLKASADGRHDVSAALGADGRATVRFGKLSVGAHTFKVRVTDPKGATLAENDYRGLVREPCPKGPKGRKLNNFVTELVNAPLVNGTVKFFRPEDGWVWISFDGDVGAARGYLDKTAYAVVRAREDERRIETQRYVQRGWHELEVRDAKEGGRLRIHAVKVIAGDAPCLRRGKCLQDGAFSYTLPFMRRFDGFVFNTLTGAQKFALSTGNEAAGYFRERGICLVGGGGGCGVFHPKRQDQQSLYDMMTSESWRARLHVLVDENPVELHGRWGTYVSRYCDWIYSENVWRMNEENPVSQVNTYYSDTNYGAVFLDRESKTSEIAAIVNSGRGTGLLVPEAYAPSLADPEASGRWEGYFARFLKSTTDFVPAARGKTLFWMAPYITLTKWSSYTSPEVDLKAHYSRLMSAFATKDEFADIGGLGFGALTSANDEVRRWGHRLLRHYCLEGGTDDLALRYGFVWAPGFVKNPDFAERLDCWTAKPAEEGTIAAERVVGYGRALQGRQNCPAGVGDGLAVFTSAKKANRLEQKLSGLVPGKCYALEFTVADHAGIATKDGTKKAPVAFSASLEGGEEVRALRYRLMRNRSGCPQFAHERYVFKATSADATLVFADREPDGAAAPVGTKQAVNHVVFQPFYLESPEELADVVDQVTTVR